MSLRLSLILVTVALGLSILLSQCATMDLAIAHMENPQACAEIPQVHHMKKLGTFRTEDGRDHVEWYDGEDGDGQPDVEVRYALDPQGNKAKHPLSVWMHREGPGQRTPWFDVWYLDPRGHGKCGDILKFEWQGDHYALIPLVEA